MIKLYSAFLFFSFFSLTVAAQNSGVKGSVKDDVDQSAVPGATVLIYLKNDSSKKEIKSTVTNGGGGFELSGLENDSFMVEISSVGYEKKRAAVTTTGGIEDLGTISLFKKGTQLQDVTVVAQAPPVVQKGDTSQFSASQFKVNPDATTEDLIKKMPGITVDKSGTVTAQGEQVRKVTIDGKDFFGDDASAALKNLPSEVVDKIQVFDRLSDQAQLTGFDDGNSVRAINVVTKTGVKNGQFGRAYTGYGTDERYAAGGNVSFFKGNRRISLVGNFNNVNQQNFGSQDLLGITGSGGGGRGGGGGGGGRGGGGSDNFTVGQSNGISKTNALGINYGDQWGKKVSVTGSYFYNNSKNVNSSLVSTETLGEPKQYSFQQSDVITANVNHRINLRLEYKIDSNNSIFVIPSINLQSNNSATTSGLQTLNEMRDSVNRSISNGISDRDGYNIRNNVMYRHSFPKKGRTISVGFNTIYTKNDGRSTINALYRFYDSLGTYAYDSIQNQLSDNNTNGHTIGANIAYTEPIGKKGQIQLNYTPSIQENKADQQAYHFDGVKYSEFDSSLSNRFDNTITTNNAGISYRRGQSRDEQLSFGINYQHSKLESDRFFPTRGSLNQNFSNLLPSAMWRKKLSATSNIRVFYRASTNFPSVNQLQDVVNLSNPLRVSSGNPALKQSYTNLLSARYTYTNSKTSRSFFANIFLQTAADYISNATYIAASDSVIQQNIILKQGSQLTKPVNLDGYKNLRTFFTYSMPVKPLKTTVNINTGFMYSRLPGLTNYVPTVTNNYVYNAGIVLASNISEYVDFNLSYNANINNAITTSSNTTTNNYVNQVVGLQLNLLSKNGWFVQNDVNAQSYTGLTPGFNQNFWLWNAAIGKKFLKKQAGELKLSVFDLLKQNRSVVRTVTGAYIEDSQSKVLQQYFMLTFTYSLKNFGVAARSFNGRPDQGGERMREGPGRGRPGQVNPSF